MQELIDSIRAAIAAGATHEQRAAGVHACRTIATALNTEPGQPLALPSTPARPSSLSGVSLDQVLDLVIARLTMVAKDREQRPPSAAATTAATPPAAPAPPRGLRLPLAATPPLTLTPRRPAAPSKHPTAPTSPPRQSGAMGSHRSGEPAPRAPRPR